jgi:Fur family ferric uptake transcriptional regulator
LRSSSVTTAIKELLDQNSPSHFSAGEIYERIRDRLPAVNPSTVYRALERMAKAGEISVSDMGTGAAVYEGLASGIHHHLVCQICGRVMTIGHEEVDSFFAAIEKRHDFHILTNHLVLFGVCSECLNKAEDISDDASRE